MTGLKRGLYGPTTHSLFTQTSVHCIGSNLTRAQGWALLAHSAVVAVMPYKSLSARAVSTSIAPSIHMPAVKPSRNSRKGTLQQSRARIILPHSHCQACAK